MRWLASSVSLLFAACVSPPPVPPGEPATRLPNVVVLYADDLGYGDLGCYAKDSKIPTPNLDRLAAEGLRCTDAHSSSGICTPSRYALLTGRHHWRRFHEIVDSFGPSVFRVGDLTLADLLRERGYRTACIGKWHLGWDWAALRRPGAEPVAGKGYDAAAFDWSLPIPDGPLAHGFAHYFGDDVPNFPPYTWIEDDRVLTAPTVPYAPDPLPREGHHEGRPGPMAEGWQLDAVMPELTRRAVAWLRERAGSAEPFFLYFPFTAPHAPIVPAAEFAGTSGAGPYGDYVVEVDAAVGAVLRALDEGGLAGDTIVVFSSDNGPEHYAYERLRRFEHASANGLRGVKRDVWEGGHRVPLLVRWPGVIAPGRTSDALVGQVDLMATIAHAVGAELPDDAAEDSFDQLPVWRGERDAVRDFLVHNTFAAKWGIRRGRWLLLAQPDGTHGKVPDWVTERFGYAANEHDVVLCDLAADPGQLHNLCEAHPDVVAELRALLADVRARGSSAPRLAGGAK